MPVGMRTGHIIDAQIFVPHFQSSAVPLCLTVRARSPLEHPRSHSRYLNVLVSISLRVIARRSLPFTFVITWLSLSVLNEFCLAALQPLSCRQALS